MKRKFDTLLGRFVYTRHIVVVEPVFANLKNKGLRRFTLRGKRKVDAQWKLFTLVHNIEKLAHCGASSCGEPGATRPKRPLVFYDSPAPRSFARWACI